MSILRHSLQLLLLAGLTVGASPAALAAPTDDEDDKQSRAKQSTSVPPRRSDDSLSEAVRRIERVTRGQVLSAERVQFDGRDINRIKVVDDQGRVRIYVDDPGRPGQSGVPERSPRTRRDDNDDPNL